MHVQGERFATMRRLFNDERTLVRVLSTFGAATREDLRALGQAHDRLDLRGIAEVAHKLKSACAQVDDTAASDCLDMLEEAASIGSSPSLVSSLVDEATMVWRNEVAVQGGPFEPVERYVCTSIS